MSTPRAPNLIFAAFVLSLLGNIAPQAEGQSTDTQQPANGGAAKSADTAGWVRLPFDAGKDGKGWQKSDFGRDGAVEFKGDTLVIGRGKPMTGIRWAGEFPKDDFEIRLEARRVDGDDFFVGLTVPIGEENVSLILGGWSGAISGLSSIDGSDASENTTSFFRKFKNGEWYKVRLRIAKESVQAWVNDEEVVNLERQDQRFGVRIEIDPSLPMGLATYSTTAEIKNFEYRKLDKSE